LVRFSMADEQIARRDLESRLAPAYALAAVTGD